MINGFKKNNKTFAVSLKNETSITDHAEVHTLIEEHLSNMFVPLVSYMNRH